jgi:hypothetical protein
LAWTVGPSPRPKSHARKSLCLTRHHWGPSEVALPDSPALQNYTSLHVSMTNVGLQANINAVFFCQRRQTALSLPFCFPCLCTTSLLKDTLVQSCMNRHRFGSSLTSARYFQEPWHRFYTPVSTMLIENPEASP